jgi:membrane-associated protease RseP (regulator of RpoE activity)
MKKLVLAVLLVVSLCDLAWGKQIFITTIRDTDRDEVRDVSIEYMMGRNFGVDRVEDYTITFTKGFGDGFWLDLRNMIVKFNLLQQGNDVKLMVTQFEDSHYFVFPFHQAAFKGQRAIEHLVPLIKDIRRAIDGTPLSAIQNEALDQQPGARAAREARGESHTMTPRNTVKKTSASGLTVDGYEITFVQPSTPADKAGLVPGDMILELNAREAEGNVKTEIERDLALGLSVIVTYLRDGEMGVTTVRPKGK